jgi:LCP family protein required for cell wall assembly
MSGTSINDFFRRQAREARGPEPGRPAARKAKRSKTLKRVALVSASSLVVVVGLVAGGAYFTVNHLASSVQRLHGITALDAAHQPTMPAATRKSLTVLLTSSRTQPSQIGGSGKLGSSTQPAAISGLISLVHLNADNRAGAVVSIPSNALVHVPGHGQMMLWNTLALGGPSLLIETVERLTNVRITHYSVLDFPGAARVVGALRGINVDVPYAFTNEGFTFPPGINHLTAGSFLAYVRQPGISQVIRTEKQQNLIRAMLDKIAQKRMFTRVATDYAVLHAMAGALSVDSNFSNSQLESLALRLGHLKGRDGTFITAPTVGTSAGTEAVHLNRRLTRKLWSAIRHDSVASFARRYPATVTPGAPG